MLSSTVFIGEVIFRLYGYARSGTLTGATRRSRAVQSPSARQKRILRAPVLRFDPKWVRFLVNTPSTNALLPNARPSLK